jgi:hypothetical protein
MNSGVPGRGSGGGVYRGAGLEYRGAEYGRLGAE